MCSNDWLFCHDWLSHSIVLKSIPNDGLKLFYPLTFY